MHQDTHQPAAALVAPNLQNRLNKPARARASNANAVLDSMGHELTGATGETAELLGMRATVSSNRTVPTCRSAVVTTN